METGSKEENMLRDQMRTLWQDRVMLTRMMLVSIAEDHDGDLENIVKRLRRNQDDIGNVLKPYLEKYLFSWDDVPDNPGELLEFLFVNFGANWIKTFEFVNVKKSEDGNRITVSSESATLNLRLNDEKNKAILVIDIGGRPHEFKFNARNENGRLNIYLDCVDNMNVLTTILKNSITISKNFLIAKKKEDIAKDLEAIEALKDNAISTAALLSGLKPAWSHKQLEPLLLDYINFLREETIARLNTDNDADLAAHEKLQKQAILIADKLVDGIPADN